MFTTTYGPTTRRLPTLPSSTGTATAPGRPPRTHDDLLLAFLVNVSAATATTLHDATFWAPVIDSPSLAVAVLQSAATQRLTDGEVLGAHVIRWSSPAAILLSTMPTLARVRTADGRTLADVATQSCTAAADLFGGRSDRH